MKKLFFIVIIVFISSCSSDDTITQQPTVINEEETPLNFTDNVDFYHAGLVDDGLVLAIKNGSTTSYIMDKGGNKLKEFTFDANLGNDLELLPSGKLIGMFKVDSPDFSFGGYGGVIKIINPDETIDWEYTLADNTKIAHHDVELLPNGNVLFLVWERMTLSEAQLQGVDTTVDVFPEALYEINPANNQLVWEWHAKDHIIQEQFSGSANFGVVSDNPQLIDINYNSSSTATSGDIMHANGIDYDAVKDVIYMSVNFYNEVWVIDHSTTSAEAASHNGGNYNKGGDLLYRFGNPNAYNNTSGTQLFYNNHFPNLLEGDEPGAGNVLIYMNGNNVDQSYVYELKMPDTFNLAINTDNEPEIIWSYTNTDLYFARLSGAVRLPNGNTLICEGDYGLWEVTPDGELAWKYNNGDLSTYWRAYSYKANDPGILNLGL